MRTETFLKELEKFEVIRVKYKSLLEHPDYNGLEIVPIQGFLQEILTMQHMISEYLNDDHKSMLNKMEESYRIDCNEVYNSYKNQISKKNVELNEKINSKKNEADNFAANNILELKSKISYAEKEMNQKFSLLNFQKEEFKKIYESLEKPEHQTFLMKSNKELYCEKFEIFSHQYQELLDLISINENSLKLSHDSETANWKTVSQAQIGNFYLAFQAFKSDEEQILVHEIQLYEAKQNAELASLQIKHASKETSENSTYTNQVEEEKQAFLIVCKSFFMDEKLLRRIESQKRNKFCFSNFQTPKRLPEYIDQGYLSFTFEESDINQISGDLLAEIWGYISGFNCASRKYTLSLPFLKNASTGIDYFLAMNTKENVKYIRTLVFSILMQFPAGKMNLVMIDPRTSTSFAGLVKLGEDDKSIIDTKVWSSDGDIQAAIARFNDKLNETVNKYGSAIDKCLEKENHTIMAIADFPQGFSTKALRDLAIILENGPKYGVNFVIAQNDEEMKAKETSPEFFDLIERIRKRMHVYTNENSQINCSMSYDEKTCVVQHLFETEVILKDDTKIVNAIYEHLSDNFVEIITQDDVHTDLLSDEDWLSESSKEGISLPVGIKGIDDKQRLVLGRTNSSNKRHHVLIEGTTGSGKSVLLHAIISSALMKYSPRELQVLLLDFKEGVEFKVYADYDLPGVRVVSTESEREFGRNVFKLMVEEHESRSALFKNELPDSTVPNIHDYREKTKKPMPIILFIIDEFETLLGNRNDDISQDIIESLSLLVKQGRSSGIHVVLSSQNMTLPENISSQMAIRFALNGSKHVLDANNNGVELLKANQAIFNDDGGSRDRNTVFQVMYAIDNLRNTLKKISEIEAAEDYEPDMSLPKKVLYANIEDYIRHPFNEMILNQREPESLTKDLGEYAVRVGENYDFYEELLIVFRMTLKNNLLVLTKEDYVASRIGVNILFGLLFSDCANRNSARKQFITILDFESGRSLRYNNENARKNISDMIQERILYLSKEDSSMESVPFKRIFMAIEELYQEYLSRKNEQTYQSPRFLVIFGLERTRILVNYNTFYMDDNETDEISVLDQLKVLMREGASYGVHIIAFVKDYALAKEIFEPGFEKMFIHRIASKIEEELLVSLVSESKGSDLNNNSAIYYNCSTDDKKRFRVLEIPKYTWIEKFCSNLKRSTLFNGTNAGEDE